MLNRNAVKVIVVLVLVVQQLVLWWLLIVSWKWQKRTADWLETSAQVCWTMPDGTQVCAKFDGTNPPPKCGVTGCP